MPEVEYMTTMQLEPQRVWEFVRDMNNWAPFLTGYQKHEIESETDSIWTLKGVVVAAGGARGSRRGRRHADHRQAGGGCDDGGGRGDGDAGAGEEGRLLSA